MSHRILVQAEVDVRTKSSAEKWLKDQGIVPDEAIRIFYQEVVACHGLPFGAGRQPADRLVDPVIQPVGEEEVSAVSIASVTGELREGYQQGCEMLDLLKEFKAQRALRKAARTGGRRGVAAPLRKSRSAVGNG